MENTLNKSGIECEYCKKKFSYSSNLYRHLKTVHKTSTREQLNPVKCKEHGCDFGCRIMEKLIDHLCTSHDMDMEYSIHEFNNDKEYKDWKARLEKHTRSNYIQLSGSKKKLNVKRTYFYCNRSGIFKTKGTGQRKLKETIKIGGHCTSHFVLTEFGNKLEAKFCKTHYGHTCGIQHVQLKKKEKRIISSQINQGASVTNILDTVRLNLSMEFKQMKDLTNHLIGNMEFTVFDVFSLTYNDTEAGLASWVERVKNLGDYNPVKFFKPRGIEDQYHHLGIEDFALLVITTLQEEILRKSENNLLCIDKITQVKNSGLGLVSILVTNDEGHAIPVSFFVSNKQDKKMFGVFFQILKKIVGEIRSKSIMVEDTDIVLTAWKSVMPVNVEFKHVISPWKVDKTWRENLGQLSDQYSQATVYKTIKALHTEICIERFNILLTECLNTFFNDPTTEDFGNYFKHFYSGEPCTWAYCFYRIDEGNLFINLEATRNALRYVFNKGVEMNQMESAMVALLKMFRDNFQDIVIKFMKEKGFLSEECISERHEWGLKLETKITQITSNTWAIESEFCPGTIHTLELATEICSCQIRCPRCSICIHTYLCSCPEALNKLGLCQHVHHLVEKLRETSNIRIETMEDSLEIPTINVDTEPQPPVNQREIPNTNDFDNTSCSQTLSDLQAQMDTIESLEQRRNEALNEINNLIRAVQTSNRMESINMALKEVKSILSLATTVENEKPPSPSGPIITLEDETPVDLQKGETTSNLLHEDYITIPKIIDVTLSNAHLKENNQGIVTCPSSLATENVLETAMGSIQDALNEDSEIMIINSNVDLCELGKTEEVSTSETNVIKDDDCSQESVMLWLQSDSDIIETG